MARTLLLTRQQLWISGERCGKWRKTMSYKIKAAALLVCILAIGVAATPQNASAAQDCSTSPQQAALLRPIPLGISGGNIHSFIRKKVNNKIIGCFDGTLGSLLQE